MAARAELLLPHLERWLGRASTTPDDDASLLQRFVVRKDETAFAALLVRHGPMVHGVCRRILRDAHEAEDAFQAVFLLLVRKAGSLRHPETLAAWLYGTARRVARMAQRSNYRRQQRERKNAEMPCTRTANPLDELSARELLLILDEEIERLPERYRLPLILCGLQGRSQAEAARQLGWTPDSVRGRLERGRARLRARLVRRGLTLGASFLALESMSTTTVSAALRQATVRMALTFASGSSEGIAAGILALMETGIKSIPMTTARLGLILTLGLGLVAGTCLLADPLRDEKQVQEKQATAASSPEGKSEASKLASDKQRPTDLYGDPLPAGAIARMGTVRFRHGGWLNNVLVSPDGQTVISSGSETIELWDARSGRRKRRITCASPSFCGIDLSPDGKLLAVANSPNKMRFWDLPSGEEVHPFGDAAPLAFRVVFSPNGNLLATRDAKFNQNTVSIWDLRAGKKVRTIEALGVWMLRCLTFSPNSKLLAFATETGVCVWDVAADKELHRLNLGMNAPVGCVAFSSDGKLLAASANPYKDRSDFAIHLWDTSTGNEAGALKGHEDSIVDLAVCSRGNQLASSSWDGTIRCWDLESRKELGKCPGRRQKHNLTHLAVTADGSVLASGDYNGVICLWDARTRQEIASPASGVNCVDWAAFSSDGQTLITTATEQLGLWDPLTGRPRRSFDCQFLEDLYTPALSPDGKSLTTVDWMRGQALLWDVTTGTLVRRFGQGGPTGLVSSCAFSADGRRLAGGSYREDIIRLWDVASGKELQHLKGQHLASSVAFSPDGSTMASASTDASSDYNIRLWKLATGAEIWRKVTRPWTAFDIAFSPDGRTLALVGGLPGRFNTTGEVRLWEAATGKELRHFEGHSERVRCVAFSADGRMLATGSLDNSVRLWEVATGQQRRCFQGHQNKITAISFSADARLLASASSDTTALVWDLTGRFRDGRFQPRRLTSEEVNRCWHDLADADAARAYRSIMALWGSPKEAVAFLKNHLSPMTAVDSKLVAPLLAALDSEQFNERDKAMSELEELGLAAEPALRAAINAKPSLEVRRRIEAVLEKLAAGPRLRLLRAFETLERIATPEARQLLETMSKGSAELWPTQEAKATLARLSARPTLRP